MNETDILPAEMSAMSTAELCERVADHLPVCIAYVDSARRFRYANARYQELFDRPIAEILGRPVAEVVGQENYRAVEAHIDRVLTGKAADFEQDAHYPSLGRRTAQICYLPDRRDDGTIAGYFIWSLDITTNVELREALVAQNKELRRAAEALEYQALHDPLTGFGNRRLFKLRMEHAISLARRSGKGLAVLLIDLDKFKRINDRFGHAAGDTVLLEAARRLAQTCRTADTLCRLGGDEFVLLMETVVSEDGVQIFADRIEAALMQPIALDDTDVTVGASIGVAITRSASIDVDRILNIADRAMYRVKLAGGGIELVDIERLEQSGADITLCGEGEAVLPPGTVANSP